MFLIIAFSSVSVGAPVLVVLLNILATVHCLDESLVSFTYVFSYKDPLQIVPRMTTFSLFAKALQATVFNSFPTL